jgi:hypothetical protein
MHILGNLEHQQVVSVSRKAGFDGRVVLGRRILATEPGAIIARAIQNAPEPVIRTGLP